MLLHSMRWVVRATCTCVSAMYALLKLSLSWTSAYMYMCSLFIILILKYHFLNWKHPLTVLLCQFFLSFRFFLSVLAYSTFAHNSSPCISNGIQSVETCDRDLCGNRQIESTYYFKHLPFVHCTIIFIDHNCWPVYFGFIWRWSDIIKCRCC